MKDSMNKIYVLTFAVVFLFSCKPSSKDAVSNSNETAVEDTSTSSSSMQMYPSIDTAQFVSWVRDVDAIDIIFHNLPISVNQTDKPSVQSTVLGLNPKPMMKPSCPSMGRLFMQIKGEIVCEAEIYYQSGVCATYVMYKDGKTLGTAEMTGRAINFYEEIIKNSSE